MLAALPTSRQDVYSSVNRFSCHVNEMGIGQFEFRLSHVFYDAVEPGYRWVAKTFLTLCIWRAQRIADDNVFPTDEA